MSCDSCLILFFKNLIRNQEGPAFDFGELEQAIGLQGGVKISNNDDGAKSCMTFDTHNHNKKKTNK